MFPKWMSMKEQSVRIQRGCKQGAPESPTLRNLVLGEALEGVIKGWQRQRRGVRLPTLETESSGKRPKRIADGDGHINHLACADGILLIGTSAEETHIMHEDILKACQQLGLKVQEARTAPLEHASFGRHAGWHKIKPEACIDVLGTFLCGDRNAPVCHRVALRRSASAIRCCILWRRCCGRCTTLGMFEGLVPSHEF